MPADTDPKTTAPQTPFARKPVAWGRPPAVTFRAGPLPKATAWPDAPPAAEPRKAAPRSTGSILGGSMIPQPAARPATLPLSPVEQASGAAAVAPTPRAAPVPPVSPPPAPDLTVRPLPPADDEPAAGAAGPALTPTAVEAPVVSPTLIAATAHNKPSGRLPLYAGGAAAAVAVIAGGLWFANRPAEPAAEAPAAEAVVIQPAPAAPLEATAPAIVEAEPAGAVVETPAPAPVEAPIRAREPVSQPAPAARPPAATPPNAQPSAVAPAPVVIIAPAPPVTPPPTAAERPAQDPDAPVATRPQPLEGE